MRPEEASAELLRSLGLDPNTIERFVIDHKVGGRVLMTVWHVVHEYHWQNAVSHYTKVYELFPKPMKEDNVND